LPHNDVTEGESKGESRRVVPKGGIGFTLRQALGKQKTLPEQGF
jgi:hypothetical protein